MSAIRLSDEDTTVSRRGCDWISEAASSTTADIVPEELNRRTKEPIPCWRSV